jgi:putative transcriptional regulator
MTPSHHPAQELLFAHAMGVAGEALSLIVAAHLSFCPLCRKDVALMESMGGALLEDTPPETMGETSFASLRGRLDAPVSHIDSESPSPKSDAVPGPLRPYVTDGYARIGWRPIAKGLSCHWLLRRKNIRVCLFKSGAGASIGSHSHRNNELTLVLAGGFADEAGQYGPGDFVVGMPNRYHTPIADRDGDCVTLIVTDAPLKFRNFAAGLLARIFGF